MSRTGCLVLGGVVLAFVVGCTGKSREAAQAATERFRARTLRGAFAEIYGAAAPDLRAAGSEEQFVKMMDVVGRKLGRWQSAEPQGWRALMGTGGRTVTLGFKSQFEKGVGHEEFQWRIQDPEPALVSYRINSPLLMPE
jgi:hypothetical protein